MHTEPRMSGDWPELAACRDADIDLEIFFPLSETGLGAHQIAAAREVCAQCPVAAYCLDWALRSGEPAGVWGGTTPDERRLLRRYARDAHLRPEIIGIRNS
jgi:WhiB family transcriptional regulator, redox-sensing transcriptional regulator